MAVSAVGACGDDSDDPSMLTATGISQTGGADSSGDTGDATVATDDDDSTGDPAADSTSAADDMGSESSGATTTGETTGGVVGDPEYPQPQDMNCAGGLAPLTLPGGSVCAPFCTGEGDACPSAATGDAMASCTPFEERGGSGTPCRDSDGCLGDEACGLDGTCIAVAFWACRLLCDAGQTCPDSMSCGAIGSCAYP